jgi:hypothetical protein
MHNSNSRFILTLTLLPAFALLVLATNANISSEQASTHVGLKLANPLARTICAVSQSPAPAKHAYHSEPPDGPLPLTLDPSQFANNDPAFVAYAIARRIPDVLYQEPCTCGCDREVGHESLLNCFTTQHGGHCNACQLEVYFCFEQHKAGTKAADIREGIERRDYRKIDREKYAEMHHAEVDHAK